MDEQFSLLGIPRATPRINSLFLAIFPDSDTAVRIAETAEHLCVKFGLKGKLLPSSHFHIPLAFIGEYPDVPAGVVQAVTRACEAVAGTSPFPVALDRVTSYRGRPGSNHPVVMIRPEGNEELATFRQQLIGELEKQQCPDKGLPKFNPHLTLLHDKKHLPEQAMQEISWVANEVVLIQSVVGMTEHRHLGCWKFGG